MKKTLLILLSVPLLANAQNQKDSDPIFPEVDGKVVYTGVENVDSMISKQDLFNRAKAWFVVEYKSAKDVIQMEDKEAGTVIGKGIFEAPLTYNFMGYVGQVSVYHTVKIYTKQGKYKYEITDFSSKYYTEEWKYIPVDNKEPVGNKKNKIKFLKAVNAKVIDLIASLKKAMTTKSPNDF